MANIQMLSDAPVVCSKCRCLVCRIVLSEDVCRCGVAHGKPSTLNQVCARCYGLIEAGAFAQPGLGIVADAISAFEETVMDEGMDDGTDEEFDEPGEQADFSETREEMSESSDDPELLDDQEFLIDSDATEESIAVS
jgi:hypothetical protein